MLDSPAKPRTFAAFPQSDMWRRIAYFVGPMVEWLKQLAYAMSLRFKSRARLEAENLVLRQQLNVLIRKLPKRLRLTNGDRLLLIDAGARFARSIQRPSLATSASQKM
jgi:hypothetical protein